MSGPTELSFDEILKFMLTHNGKVTNHELVKYFKVFLTNPDMRDEARSTFKKHVNSLAIIKNHNNEKWLILKKKYIPSNGKESGELLTENVVSEPLIRPVAESSNDESSMEPIPPRPPLPLHLNQDFSILNTLMQNNSTFQASLEPEHLVPEPQQSPIEQVAPSEQISTNIKNDPVPSPLVDLEAPKINPRRKSTTTTEKNVSDKQPSLMQTGHRTTTSDQDNVKNETITSSKSENMLVDGEQKISVKERKQMFNRMASEGDMLRTHPSGGLNNSQGIDEEDRASVISLDHKGESDPLDSKQKAWILCAARGEYHALAKMCSENAKLTRTKDPFTTAMHWACKRGDENLVKLLAGVSRNIVNERSGYTPLHIAMQFRHENVYKLLVDVYDADSTLRDWAGKKARQYLVHMDTSLSPGSYRKTVSMETHRTVSSAPSIRVTPNPSSLYNPHSSKRYGKHEKESFLRIGSLNVRVKKTTEAFSNFLGVGATRSSAYVPKSARMDDRRDDDQLHKTWGSADNIAPKDDKLMPPPPSSKIRRRGTSGRKGLSAAHSRSTPSTPDQPRAHLGVKEEGDSDSDSAAGFHAAWRHQRASDCL